MATTKHKNGRTYAYAFWFNGVRFRGPTGCTTKREADKFEARVRADLERGNPPEKRRPEMSLSAAAHRWWEEAGSLHKNKSIFGQLGRLVDRLGGETMLSRITMSELAAYQAQRRAEDGVGASTINAEINEVMAWILKRAEKVWGVNVGEPRDWPALKLSRPAPRVRAMRTEEETRFFAALRPDYHRILHFAIATGLRKQALIIRHDQIDFDAGVLVYDRKSKLTGNIGHLPITRRMRVILQREARIGKDAEFVFTYVCRRSREERQKGQRYPITAAGLREAVDEAVALSGLVNWRALHDFRHTAATRVLGASKNLKAVQNMLGHSDIAQTARYAHALIDDVRDAMERRNPAVTPYQKAARSG